LVGPKGGKGGGEGNWKKGGFGEERKEIWRGKLRRRVGFGRKGNWRVSGLPGWKTKGEKLVFKKVKEKRVPQKSSPKKMGVYKEEVYGHVLKSSGQSLFNFEV